MIIQPSLLKVDALATHTRVFLCGPGFSSGDIVIREKAKEALQEIPRVEAIYGEEIEDKHRYRRIGTDLQTLEAQFAHDVDFTLLILESPGAMAELGTFTQLPALRDRLFVLLSERYYRAESYIARGPLSLLTRNNPNSVIYYNSNKLEEMLTRVRYPLTFYKYVHFLKGFDYVRTTRFNAGRSVTDYTGYITPIRQKYETAITLISILIGESASYADLLLYSGLAPKQLNAALHTLFAAEKIEKTGSGRYRSINGFGDALLDPFSTTEISRLRSRTLAA